MSEHRSTDAELAAEAARWDCGELTPAGWTPAPDAPPRAGDSIAVSIRLPKPMVVILKEFARRQGVGHQVLMKRWLDDRIRQEHAGVKADLARAAAEAASRDATAAVLPRSDSAPARAGEPQRFPATPPQPAVG